MKKDVYTILSKHNYLFLYFNNSVSTNADGPKVREGTCSQVLRSHTADKKRFRVSKLTVFKKD